MIVLRAKNVDFEVTYINLGDKPDWFLKISPHAKVPVLVVDDVPLFESNAIVEYLEETIEPRLHPADPIKRARNRAWTDFIEEFASALSGIYYTKTKEAIEKGIEAAPKTVAKLEHAIAQERSNDGPYFNGDKLSLVDAAYTPFLMRFGIAENVLGTGLLKEYPLVQAWSDTLMASDCVKGSVADVFEAELVANWKRREFLVGGLIEANTEAAE